MTKINTAMREWLKTEGLTSNEKDHIHKEFKTILKLYFEMEATRGEVILAKLRPSHLSPLFINSWDVLADSLAFRVVGHIDSIRRSWQKEYMKRITVPGSEGHFGDKAFRDTFEMHQRYISLPAPLYKLILKDDPAQGGHRNLKKGTKSKKRQ